jgi:hypothetical protein
MSARRDQQVAARGDRTLAGQIRHWVAEAARRAAPDLADRGRTE